MHLVVAPHEFFLLHPAGDRAVLERAAAASVCINTEQPGSPWFELAAQWCDHAVTNLDISDRGVAAMQARGLVARRLRLGYSQGRDVWAGASTERNVDVVFLGDDSVRRREVLNRGASQLWPYRCELRLFRSDRPVLAGRPGFLGARERVELLARSRVLINVHRGDQPYFEWVRLLDALANGCVVVSEPSSDSAPLEPSTHMVEAPVEKLVETAIELLHDEPRRQRIAHAAYDVVRRELDSVVLIDKVLRDLA
jgi:hypothetical protein